MCSFVVELQVLGQTGAVANAATSSDTDVHSVCDLFKNKTLKITILHTGCSIFHFIQVLRIWWYSKNIALVRWGEKMKKANERQQWQSCMP